jgi:hypothetical protein
VKRRQHKSLIYALTRHERAELSALNERINGVSRVLQQLVARRNHILGQVPDHKIIVPKIPHAPTRESVQPSLF